MRLVIATAGLGMLAGALGDRLNNIVMAANGGRMPVFYGPGDLHQIDPLHAPAVASTVLGWLGDWISLSIAGPIASPGDYLIWGAEWLTPALVVLAIAFRLLQRFN